VTFFARADTRARMNPAGRRQSRVAAIVDARPGYGEIDSAAASISSRQDAIVTLSMAAKIEECLGKQQARRALPVPLHRGFDVSAERRLRVPNVWPR
jgi:hypothetical protein